MPPPPSLRILALNVVFLLVLPLFAKSWQALDCLYAHSAAFIRCGVLIVCAVCRCRAVELKEEMRRIDVDANGEMALLEYLLFKVNTHLRHRQLAAQWF